MTQGSDEAADRLTQSLELLQTAGIGELIGEATPIVGAIWRYYQGRMTKARFEKLESFIHILNKKTESYRLPNSFEEQKQFEEFSIGILEIADQAQSSSRRQMLAHAIAREAADVTRTPCPVKTKVIELLRYFQPVHAEILNRIEAVSHESPEEHFRNSERFELFRWEESIQALRSVTGIKHKEVFYSAVSDLLRWYLLRSIGAPVGVNIAKVAEYIPGTRTAAHLIITDIGRQMLGYLRDGEGNFIDFSAFDEMSQAADD